MKLKYKLILSFLIISLLAGIIAYYGIESNNSFIKAYGMTNDQTIPIIKALKDIKFSSAKIELETFEILDLIPRNPSENEYQEKYNELESEIESYNKSLKEL